MSNATVETLAKRSISVAYDSLETSGVSGAARESLYSSGYLEMARNLVTEARRAAETAPDSRLADRAEELEVDTVEAVIVQEAALFLEREVLEAEISVAETA